MDDEVPRRTYLSTLLATGLSIGVAGCNASSDNSESNRTAEITTSASDQAETKSTTATPNQAPKILAHDATPQDKGTALAVSLEGEDDDGIALARIEYSEESIERTPESASVALDEEITDLSGTDIDTTSGQATFLLRDTAGKETRARVNPDETVPELQTFAVEPAEKAGEVVIRLGGRDETGLKHAAMLLGEQTHFRENVSGQTEYSTDQRISVPENAQFKQNTVTASLTDWNGNSTESEGETYVRKYDVMSDTQFDIAVNYFTAGEMMFKRCLEEGVETQPEVGAENYDSPIRPEVTTQHIDQMQGHGINRVQFNFGGGDKEDDREQVQALFDAGLASDIEIEPTYWASQPYRWTEDADKKQILEDDMTYMRDHFLKRENAVTHEGRPVVGLENPWSIVWNYGDEIIDEWGEYESFIDEMRSYLTVDGTKPFIRANAGMPAYKGFKHGRGGTGEEAFISTEEFFSYFDAVSQTQLPSHPDSEGEIASWDEVSGFREQMFRNCREFADNHNMEYFPKVMAGFDSRANTCWGENHPTNIYRSTENLQKELRLAEKYGTSDKIHVFTWNDWTEGTQIEPGTFRGTDYGTEYLEVVKEFQTSS